MYVNALSLSLSLSLSHSEGAPTVLIKCRVWLVTVRLFPETMQTFGVCHRNPSLMAYSPTCVFLPIHVPAYCILLVFVALLSQLDLYDVLSQQPTGTYTAVADNPYRELLGK